MPDSPKGGSNGGKGPDDASSGKAEEGQDPNSSPPVTTDTAETTEASEDDCTPFYGRDYTRKQDPKNNQELPGGDSSYDSIDQLSGMVQNLDLASDGVPYSRFSAAGETQTSDFPSSQGEATASGEMSISSNRPTNYPEIPSIWGDSTTTPCDPALYPPDANSSFPSDNRVASSFSDPESHLFETTSHLLTSSYASPSTDAYSDSRSSAYSDFSPTTLPDNPLGFAYSILSFSDQSNLTFPDSTFESSGHKDYSSGGNDSYY